MIVETISQTFVVAVLSFGDVAVVGVVGSYFCEFLLLFDSIRSNFLPNSLVMGDGRVSHSFWRFKVGWPIFHVVFLLVRRIRLSSWINYGDSFKYY